MLFLNWFRWLCQLCGFSSRRPIRRGAALIQRAVASEVSALEPRCMLSATVSGLPAAPLSFVQDSGPLQVAPNATVSEIGKSTTAKSAVVSITNYVNGEDVLSINGSTSGVSGGISYQWNPNSGTLTLTGNASLSAYQNALRQVNYQDTNLNSPNSTIRSINFKINDGSGFGPAASAYINIDDNVQTVGSGFNYTTGNTPNGPTALPISNTLTIPTPAGGFLYGASVRITGNYVQGEDVLTYSTKIGNITGTFVASTGTLVLSGQDTAANYQAALRSITYTDISATPTNNTRRLDIWTGTAIAPSPRFPATQQGEQFITVQLHSASVSNMETSTATYNNGANPLQLTAAATLSDSLATWTTATSATVQITSNYVNGDLLTFNNSATPNIGYSWNGTNGKLTLTALSGTDTLANFQTALRNVFFSTTNVNPNARQVTFSVFDGSNVGVSQSRYVSTQSPVIYIVTAASATPNPVTANTTNLSVLGGDINGASTLTYTWSASGPTGANSPTYTVNGTNAAQNTTATFYAAGSYTFTVTIKDQAGQSITSSVIVVVSQTVTSIKVTPANPIVNASATQQFTATASDQFGNTLTTQPTYTWSITGVGSVNKTGLYTAPAASGTATVTATYGTVSGSTNINVAPPIYVATDAAANPNPVTGTTTVLSVLGGDVNGESTLTYNWAATGPAGATAPTYSVNGTNAAKNTTATFYKAGTYTFTVTITDQQNRTMTSSVIVVVSQTPSTLTVSPANKTLLGSQPQQFTVTGNDQFGNAITGTPSVIWSASAGKFSTTTNGLYTSPASYTGYVTVIAQSTVNSSVTGTATVYIIGPPIISSAASATPSPVTGTQTFLSVSAYDYTYSNLTYTWTTTAAPNGVPLTGAGSPTFSSSNGTTTGYNTTVTFYAAGSYTFQVTINDGHGQSVTSSVSVTVIQTLTTITVTPAAVTLLLAQTQQFVATSYDQFGVAMANQPAAYAWAVATGGAGTVGAATGLYTAPTTSAGATQVLNSATVTATVGTVSGAATVYVEPPPTIATAATANPSPVTGTTTGLSVIASDVNLSNIVNYNWIATSVPGGAQPPTFSATNNTINGNNTVVTFYAAGSYTFQVTITDKYNQTVTSSVTVVVNQTLTSIVVTPLNPSLGFAQTQQMTATGLDQFNAPLTTQPTFTWAVVPGGAGGTISTGGLYTAPAATTGSDKVTATSGSVIGFTTVSIQQVLTTIKVTSIPIQNPVINQTLGVNEQIQYVAKAYDQTGVLMVTQPTFTWSVPGSPAKGTVSSTGLYTAPNTAVGAVTITASATGTGGPVSGSASATVAAVVGGPSVASAASANPGTISGNTTALSVLGADPTNGEPTLTYTWSTLVPPPGVQLPTFSVNNSNAAKNTTATFYAAGTYTFQVTITDQDNQSVTSNVTVVVNQTFTSITVTPNSTPTTSPGNWVVLVNQQQQFVAVANDQFGNAITVSPPAITWNATNTGTINTSGLFTAGAVQGPSFVTASNGSVKAQIVVNVMTSYPPPTVQIAAAANPNPVVTGTTTNLSVLGQDFAGENTLTYTWTATGPNGAIPANSPGWSVNGTNAAKNTVFTFTAAGTYTFTVTISDQLNQTVTSMVTVTVNQVLTSVTVTPPAPTIDETQTQQFTATGLDQFGNAMLVQPTFTWSVLAGAVGSVNSLTGVYTAPAATTGTDTVKATSGAFSATATVTVDTLPTVAIAAKATPSTVTLTTTNLTVLGADVSNPESSLTYTWAATTVPPGATGPNAPTFSANGTNGAKSTTVTFHEAGTYIFQVTIADQYGGSVTSSVTVTVNQTLTSITVNPANPTVGATLTQQFTATAYDQFNIAMTVQPTITWSVVAGGAGGTINSSSGLYTAPIISSGSDTVKATSGATSGTTTVTLANPSPPTVGTAASASPSPVTGTTTTLSVVGADVPSLLSSLTYTWAATTVPPGATGPKAPTFSVNGTNTAKNTTATFHEAGTYTFTVTIKDPYNQTVTSQVVVNVNQTLTTITVTAAKPMIDVSQTDQFSATGYDQFNIAMASQPTFTWSVVTGGAGGTVSSTGLYTANGSTGTATIKAAVASPSVSGTAAVTVDPLPTVATAANVASQTLTTANLSVLGADSVSPESTLTYTWAATTVPTGATGPNAPAFSVNGTNAAKNTTVTFHEAGSYVFTVTITDAQGGTVTSIVSVTVSQALTSISVTPTTPTIDETQTEQFSAVGNDQFNNLMTSQPTFTWTNTGVGSINSTSGLYTAPTSTPGSSLITATSGKVNGSTSITVDSPPTVQNAASVTPLTPTTALLSAFGADASGESTLTYTWVATSVPTGATGANAPTFTVNGSTNGTNAAQDTVVTYHVAGSYTFRVTITDAQGGSVTSSVTVNVSQVLTSITVTPATPSVYITQQQQFTATGYDQFGNTMTSQPSLTWSVVAGGVGGTVNSSGLYTAPGTPTGTDTVKAVNGSVSGTSTITVNAPSKPSVANGASETPLTATTATLSALGSSQIGEANLTYTWAATSVPAGATGPNAPTFSPNGTNAAKSSIVTFHVAGSYTFQVTITDPLGQSVTSSVTVTVNQALTTITVTPAAPTIDVGLTQQFTATGYDQFANAMTSQPTFTWSVLAGGAGGTVNSNGLYTAPGSAGTDTVQASSAGVHGSTTVTVDPALMVTTGANLVSQTSTTANLNVVATDPLSTLTYTWAATTVPPGATGPNAPTFSVNGTSTSNNTTVTFYEAGTYVFTVTIADQFGGSATSSVTVNVSQNLTSITVTRATAALDEGQQEQFQATGYDQFGNAMSVQPAMTWGVTAGGVGGSIDQNGLYTAPNATGSDTITATNGLISGSNTVNVYAPPTVGTAANLTTANPMAGTPFNLQVAGSDPSAGQNTLKYTWIATVSPAGAIISYSANRTNAAQSTNVTVSVAGSYTFLVLITDQQGVSVTSSVTVVVA